MISGNYVDWRGSHASRRCCLMRDTKKCPPSDRVEKGRLD